MDFTVCQHFRQPHCSRAHCAAYQKTAHLEQLGRMHGEVPCLILMLYVLLLLIRLLLGCQLLKLET